MLFEPAGSNPNNTDDELHDDHSAAPNDKDPATTEAFDNPEGEGGRADVDEGRDEGDEERILDRAEGGEEDGSEVEDKVNTSQLLHHLHENTYSGCQLLRL